MNYHLTLADPILVSAVVAYLFLPWREGHKTDVVGYFLISLAVVCAVQYAIRQSKYFKVM